MAEFVFRKRFNKRSKKALNSIIKQPTSVSVFRDESNNNYFEIDDVSKLRHKRNNAINEFFSVYSDKSKYDLVEFGVPYIVTSNISRIIQKVKRRCENNGTPMLGFIWVFDVGEENFGEHYHFAIAIKKRKKRIYPDFLKISFKDKKIHGSYVKDRTRFKRYLLAKMIFERGYRKRIYGISRRLKVN